MSYIPLPAGITFTYAGSSAPSGWLMCDGAAVSRTTYAALFATIGTTYGVGDGATTFNVPDARGRAVIASGTGAGLTARTLGNTSIGAESHTLDTTQIPSHTHSITDVAHGHSQRFSHGGGGQPPRYNFDATVGAGTFSDDASGILTSTTGITGTNASGSGGSHNNMQPSIVLNYIIKT